MMDAVIFPVFLLRQQRIGTRGHLTCSRRLQNLSVARFPKEALITSVERQEIHEDQFVAISHLCAFSIDFDFFFHASTKH